MSECKIAVGLIFFVLRGVLPLLCERCISATVPHGEAAPVLAIRVRMAANTTSKPTFCHGFRALRIHPMASAPLLYRVRSRVSSLACGGNPYQETDAEGQARAKPQLLTSDPAFAHQRCTVRARIKQHGGTAVVNMSRLLKMKLSQWKADWWPG